MYQPNLFRSAASFDYASVKRIQLDAASWVDYGKQFLRGADALFEQIRDQRPGSSARASPSIRTCSSRA